MGVVIPFRKVNHVPEGKLFTRVTGAAGNYNAYVMERKGDQVLVKHIIFEGFKTVSDATRAERDYKELYPNFPWLEE
mgnify:CR=1 FL=1